MKRIITIGREFGSGGHEIGKLTAEALGIAFYDKELLAAVAKTERLPPAVVTTPASQSARR